MSEQLFQQALEAYRRGHLAQAEPLYRAALALAPGDPACLTNLGRLLADQGRLEEAVGAYEQALRAAPHAAAHHYNLGTALQARGDLPGAEARYRQALALSPELAPVYNNLGNVLQEAGRFDEALAVYQEGLLRKPGDALTYNGLANTCFLTGRIDDALAYGRQAVRHDPRNAILHSNLIVWMHFHPGVTAAQLRAELRAWRAAFADPLRGAIGPHANDRAPERPLRLGYVSPNFRGHVIGRNMLPVFRHHDRRQFQVFCYADVPVPDGFTQEFRALADVFRSTSALSHDALAAQIRADGIDILVDLDLHLFDNRLLLFARKPAPVQVTCAGYPGSTGLEAIDYRLTDPHLDPPGADATLYFEKSWRLPATFWCYDPLDSNPPEPGPAPAIRNGYATFGCLNNFCKVNAGTLELWARVLAAVPDSRLLLLAAEGAHRQRTVQTLERLGVEPQRVRFVAKLPHRAYLQLYQQIDVGLDTLPYNGHTTSLDSFFMGVPVVTLVGRTIVGRAGLSQLMNLGMPELIARTGEEFVAIAQGLAGDLPRLARTRAGLRARMTASPLMDAPAFTRAIESAYRAMWRQWCPSPGASSLPTDH